jgi:hypothetical protein
MRKMDRCFMWKSGQRNWKTLRVDGEAVKERRKQDVDSLDLDRGKDK